MLKTLTKKKRESRNKKIKATYTKLIALPGAMPTACEKEVMRKFKVSRSTVYNIIKGLQACQ